MGTPQDKFTERKKKKRQKCDDMQAENNELMHCEALYAFYFLSSVCCFVLDLKLIILRLNVVPECWRDFWEEVWNYFLTEISSNWGNLNL